MFSIRLILCVLIYLYIGLGNSEVARTSLSTKSIKVNKCCEDNQIYLGSRCTVVNKTSEEWRPLFTSEDGTTNLQINYTLVTGSPDCGHMQLWPIYQYQNSTDRLRLLPNGILRHYFDHFEVPEEEFEVADFSEKDHTLYHDYEPGKYCLDKKEDGFKSEFAWVCAPDLQKDWLTSTEFLMRNIISPITHGITIICLLTIAIIYFVMPTLRDLTGNIITTICMCLIVSQTADTIRLLTVFKSHVSLLITGILAVFAHFTMDYPEIKAAQKQQDEIGSLGMIIFFVPVAFTVLVDIFFFATTMKTINKMHTYGRIHHKLRHSFRMFLLLLLVMTFCWLFFLSSFSKYDGLINSHIIMNALQGPLILYTCVFNQKHVSYLIRKTCCYANCICPCCRPEPECEWGDEMTAMNTELNY
ncbi:hypothetical protein NQ314_019006 [Rhamnusium bicolor]|uniref:G-protein coupled receptor Mth-like 5 n=1 Tax=Rhamnusium bicolor TaxID=1586634 RepID=A0AAV8WQ45_9CUCU|nr:hypothetical protein NQ314_019006 [Rhamnusium bicolor]